MRTTILLATILAIGCDHKSKRDEPNAEPAHAVNSAAGDRADPAKHGETIGATAGTGDVRPPTAADLADYTKDIQGSGPLTAHIETSKGTFNCQLFPDTAPATVANFIGLATGKKAWLDPNSGSVVKGKPFYDGLTFHRVIPNFMIQGGDPLGSGTGGPGYAFDDETANNPGFKVGSLAMANAGVRGGHGTNGSQFFITENAPEWLNGKHTIFGQCDNSEGVKAITALRGPGDRPTEPVTIDHVTFTKG
jgi:cyclophilin family peptidyl-prolyl cis-trans isomerase